MTEQEFLYINANSHAIDNDIFNFKKGQPLKFFNSEEEVLAYIKHFKNLFYMNQELQDRLSQFDIR